ncbi:MULTISPECIES: PqqD family peptide modification chaperone [unclassified Sphingomonas]|uniref:PqqD family peptide modification chaperone n=1 Tax=unclassified Sphingomonas TaxID=196159 RepID=UPI00070169CB|nr:MULTISPECIES: PqqD family peptide modification chaperone [unclassified Sphingomonas]KQX20753.1 hypothetical protein ASD17_07615 [Sphingomonas sp. Root1294]KQY68599.1 hypothetical protein ASD39_04135 [Sphingomonas sp. Root50]KRB88005.1 hypothetical protein ASE22_21310 [Sphingomonas sp. Root720]
MTASPLFDEAAPLARAADALGAPLEDKMLMLSVDQGSYFIFSQVTRRIWELLETPRSLSELVACLVGEYDVEPEVCRDEVRGVAGRLIEDGLVVVA